MYVNFIYFCITIFEANHNKDYSVVKTFKAAFAGRFRFLKFWRIFAAQTKN